MGKIKKAGYKRKIQGSYYVMVRLGVYTKASSKRKKREVPQVPIAIYPGKRVQVDVKYVPRECMRELKRKRRRWRIEYNNFPMRPLGWLSPKEKLVTYRIQNIIHFFCKNLFYYSI